MSLGRLRPKRLDVGSYINSKVLRDHSRRKAVEATEPERQALRYIIQNTSLPQRMRAQAQLELAKMHPYTRPIAIKPRCIMTGRSRALLGDFKMARFQFRLNALSGHLPGVRKASW